MDAEKYVRRIVNLERRDYDYIKQVAEEKGLGGKGFSAAVRLICREHQAEQERQTKQIAAFPSG